jgi:hypothetical protein
MTEHSNNGNATTNDDGTKWIVAALNRNLLTNTANCDTTMRGESNMVDNVKTLGRIITLKDPGTGDHRDYVIITDTTNNATDNNQPGYPHLVEIQDMPSDYSAFLVGRHVVKDGNLYLFSRLDPLFFYVSSQEHHLLNPETAKKKSWQPLEQCLEELDANSHKPLLPREIHQFITEEQLQHVCLTFQNDNVTYFRFDVNKTLQWLQRKHERLLQCLIRQDQHQQQRKAKLYISSMRLKHPNEKNDGDDDDDFFMPTTPTQGGSNESDKTITQHDSPPVVLSNTQSLKIQSLQLLCNYLTESWTQKVVQYLGFSVDQITTTQKQRHRQTNESQARDDYASTTPNTATATTTTTTTTSAADASDAEWTIQRVTVEAESEATIDKMMQILQKPAKSIQTLAHKRLAKVNTKGMKSIANFFGAPPKKKAKN